MPASQAPYELAANPNTQIRASNRDAARVRLASRHAPLRCRCPARVQRMDRKWKGLSAMQRENVFPAGLPKRIVKGHLLYAPVVTVVPGKLVFLSGILSR